MYVVTVEFVVKPEHAAQFRAAMIDNAQASRTLELGCRQFDVTARCDDPTVIFLYEVYDDRAAFDAHCRSEHFRRFDEASRECVVSKTVRLFDRIDP